MLPSAVTRAGRVSRLATLALLLGCTGSVADGPSGRRPGGEKEPGSDPVAPPAKPGEQPVAPAQVSAGVAPLRRLTRTQYLNTVRDLLGLSDAVAASSLPADDAINDRFHSNTVSPLQAIDVGKYADAAEAIANRAVTGLAKLVPCEVAGGDAACAARFIESFGKRAYRRPLTQEETARLQAVYASGGDFATGIRLVIAGLLQSPRFLYLREPVPASAGGKVVGVDSWALASRLSYFLLDTMPDEGLFTAAEKGQLASGEQVGEQATRLMNDPRFRGTLLTFHREWLQLGTLPNAEKDQQVYPQWTPAVRAALAEETRRFVEHVFIEGDRRLDTLLSAPYSFLDGTLATHYGVTGPAPAGWQRVELPRDQRAGLLTQAGLMATLAHENRTSFILRGKMVREALFCSAPLLPPADVPPEPKLDPTASAKERSEAHRTNPACASCHELFDPLGFAFEIYDATGRHRTSDAAGPIDAKVQLSHTAQLDGKVATNAVELARLLAGADEVRDCVARQWMRFGLSRDDAREDEPSLAAAVKAFKEGGAQLPALLVAIARSDAFRFQKVGQ
jgi:Protein of unknown function (DUF1592)/Protein of unknown function (DUF1588)/Protein of unknown function (DUF1595)/Protein of unknown function (DUF1587)/Protein of unknown function (DUF1585)